MDTATLIRFATDDYGTFGRFSLRNFKSFSGELPDLNNKPMRSCIPIGIYKVIWAYSNALKRYTYRVLNVPQRSGILMHSAAYMGNVDKGYRSDLLGCIALGEQFGWINKQKVILVSRPAIRVFQDMMNKESFMLEIKCLKS